MGVWKYDRYSVDGFLKSFDVEDYLTLSETKQMLETNGIKDLFMRFSNKYDDGIQCRYERVTNQFPMSVKNLIKYGYLVVDKDITPMLIRKDSVISSIKHFSGMRVKQQPKSKLYTPSKPKKTTPKVVTQQPSNNTDFFERLYNTPKCQDNFF
ncbi:hypothetical protein ACN9JU_01950 [Aliarcobacter butzleri]|uniref:hypothetical protein n=1 Tax=Aliarcobacter butzleri TaxID=28197 RepID=UPI003B219B79